MPNLHLVEFFDWERSERVALLQQECHWGRLWGFRRLCLFPMCSPPPAYYLRCELSVSAFTLPWWTPTLWRCIHWNTSFIRCLGHSVLSQQQTINQHGSVYCEWGVGVTGLTVWKLLGLWTRKVIKFCKWGLIDCLVRAQKVVGQSSVDSGRFQKRTVLAPGWRPFLWYFWWQLYLVCAFVLRLSLRLNWKAIDWFGKGDFKIPKH